MARIRHDPQERNPQLKKLIVAAGQQAEASLAALVPPGALGRCHFVWAEQQRLLKENHGIDWKTPAEMNPTIMFD